MYLIDTNIFLEILLDQEKADECQLLIEYIQNSDMIFHVSSFTLHSIEVVLEKYRLTDVLEIFLADIHRAKGIKRIDTSTLEELLALQNAKRLKLEFDDAIQYYTANLMDSS